MKMKYADSIRGFTGFDDTDGVSEVEYMYNNYPNPMCNAAYAMRVKFLDVCNGILYPECYGGKVFTEICYRKFFKEYDSMIVISSPIVSNIYCEMVFRKILDSDRQYLPNLLRLTEKQENRIRSLLIRERRFYGGGRTDSLKSVCKEYDILRIKDFMTQYFMENDDIDFDIEPLFKDLLKKCSQEPFIQSSGI